MREKAFTMVISIMCLVQLNYSQWIKVPSPEILIPLSTTAVTSKESTIFVGTYRGSIYRSTNNGIDWVDVGSNLSSLYWTMSLLMEGDTIYVGAENGIYRSTDNGDNWIFSNQGFPSNYNWINVSSLLRLGDDLLAATAAGIYRSSDKGLSWGYSSNGIDIDASSLVSVGNTLFAGTLKGVFRSTDNGFNWDSSNNGFPDSPIYLKRINVLGVFDSVIYAGTIDNGLWKSTDKGNNWSQYYNMLKKNQGSYYTITSFAGKDNSIHIGTQGGGVFKTTDNGISWKQQNCGIEEGAYINILFTTDTKLFAATHDGGLYSITGNDSCWLSLLKKYRGKVNTNVVGGSYSNLLLSAESSFYNGVLYGVYQTSDIGSSWLYDSILNKSYISSFKSYADSLYAYGGGLFFSSNNGNSWMRIDSGLGFINTFIKKNDSLFVGMGSSSWQWGENGEIFFSANHGKTWESISTANNAVLSLEKISNTIFRGGFHGIFRSTNNGLNWTTVNNGLPSNSVVLSLTTINTDLLSSTSAGIFLSTNFGDNWVSVNNGLPVDSMTYNAIQMLPYNDNIILGTINGIYFSTDLGANWKSVNNGLSEKALDIRSLTLFNYDLVVATGDGIWKRPLTEILLVDDKENVSPDEFQLYQNYPNPFNPSTTIKYFLPSKSKVTLKIYNLLGQAIETLIDENQDKGFHQIKWQVTPNFSSGVYFYSLTAGIFNETKKMVLLR